MHDRTVLVRHFVAKRRARVAVTDRPAAGVVANLDDREVTTGVHAGNRDTRLFAEHDPSLCDRALAYRRRNFVDRICTALRGETDRRCRIVDRRLFGVAGGEGEQRRNQRDTNHSTEGQHLLNRIAVSAVSESRRHALRNTAHHGHNSAVIRCSVTGTNGKTSTVAMMDSILGAASIRTATTSGLGASLGGTPWTDLDPELPIEEVEKLAQRSGAGAFVSEVTSRALAQGWTSRAPRTLAIYTNLAVDHYDVHRGAEGYAAAKASLFEELERPAVAVLNADDAAHRQLAERLQPGVEVRWFGVTSSTADVLVTDISVSHSRTTFMAQMGGRSVPLVIPHVGACFVLNAAACLAATLKLGLDAEAVATGLANACPPDGRFRILAEEPIVVVDFAHNAAALEATLETARALAPKGRVRLVFGAGGDRMHEKRQAMGRVAALGSDDCWITSDNSRTEDPSAIADAISAGWNAVRAPRPNVELHRPTAIVRALEGAGPEDIVVLAGMGADSYRPTPREALTTDEDEVLRFCEH